MVISESKVKIRDLVNGFADRDENGVTAFGGLLDVRPPYQREFVYDDAKQQAVIRTVMRDLPLNVFYWAENREGENVTYELVDGQQRTMSICLFVKGKLAVKFDGETTEKNFFQLDYPIQETILAYELTVFKCSGTEEEKLAWFETINTAGERLTRQELLNAVTTGMWLSDAKRYFSRSKCPAMDVGGKFMDGRPIRQEYLEEVLRWYADKEGRKSIESCMFAHRRDENAEPLWKYFREVIDWVNKSFGCVYDKDMKKVHWGILYNKYKSVELPMDLVTQVERLRDDKDVTKKSGIYAYLLSGEEKHLNIRKFDESTKKKIYRKQRGICPHCNKLFEIDQMEADHIIPWSKGGGTDEGNCQMLCVQCNRSKGAKG